MDPTRALSYKIEARCPDTEARLGCLRTPHGEITTPQFMPVGTLGSVKSLCSDELEDAGASIILANTYHLAIRPGVETLRALGGLHEMAAWRRPILTNSGGFQVLSLAALRKVTEEGVRFRNHIDGGLLDLTPEHAIAIQEAIGSDIMMCLDHLPASDAPHPVIEDAMERTTRWALRCHRARRRPDQALFAIVQGGTDEALRARHVEALCGHPFDGFAVGGLSVGESTEQMYAALAFTAPRLPADRPRYLMGVGTPDNLIEGVARGVDLFDCVLPTRNARKGNVYVRGGQARINLKNARFKQQRGPLDETCACYACRHFGAGYLRHLLLTKELLAGRMLSIHNLSIYFSLMTRVRRALRAGVFGEFYRTWRAGLDSRGAIC